MKLRSIKVYEITNETKGWFFKRILTTRRRVVLQINTIKDKCQGIRTNINETRRKYWNALKLYIHINWKNLEEMHKILDILK
jgi:5-bromo-4-chloroindolyl phosphate hydrolysis protein